MFGLFKKKSQKDVLLANYEKLLKESHRLSTINRIESDKKAAEAQAILDELDALTAE